MTLDYYEIDLEKNKHNLNKLAELPEISIYMLTYSGKDRGKSCRLHRPASISLSYQEMVLLPR
jgi:hypothetical protein